MQSPTIEELKARVEAATSAKMAADAALIDARADIKKAVLSASGYLGKLIISKRCPDGFIADDGDVICTTAKVFRLSGFALNNDGRPGLQRRHVYPDQIIEIREAPQGQAK
ncbi:hypothetical protein [Brucella intermedia]|uniref:hypothetical protein n=1 Tax=Brucella intermedia TaxID=94625 RepID=UPI0023603E0A|nr:hypothetical protein [Brucella intermedia]